MFEIKLKQEITKTEILKNDKNALICDLGFYIGTQEHINSYVEKEILEGIDHNLDNYMLFYIFCEFVVEKFLDSSVQDIYTLIDNNYIRLVGMFINERCCKEQQSYNIVIKSNDEIYGVLVIKNGYNVEVVRKMIKDIISNKLKLNKSFYCEADTGYDFNDNFDRVVNLLNKELNEKISGSAEMIWNTNVKNDINMTDFLYEICK